MNRDRAHAAAWIVHVSRERARIDRETAATTAAQCRPALHDCTNDNDDNDVDITDTDFAGIDGLTSDGDVDDDTDGVDRSEPFVSSEGGDACKKIHCSSVGKAAEEMEVTRQQWMTLQLEMQNHCRYLIVMLS